MGLYAFRRADGVAYVYLVEAGEADDVARLCRLTVYAVEALYLIEVDNLAGLAKGLIVVVGDYDRLARGYGAALYAAYAYAADVVVIVNRRTENLRGTLGIDLHRFDVVEYGFEQRR